jgi:lipopolysaccharide/colanic/teichoic acid biosynthesis glycosyltransferase
MAVQITLLLANAILINAAFLCSFLIRYGRDVPAVNFQPYRDNFVLLTVVYMLAFALAGVFRRRYASLWHLFKRVFWGVFLGTLFGLALFYVFRVKWYRFPSSVFVICFFVGLFLIFMFDAVVLRGAGRIRKKIVVIGREKNGDANGNGRYVEKKVVENVEGLIECNDIDEIIVCKRIRDEKRLNLLLSLLQKLETDIFFAPDLYGELLTESFNGNGSSRYLATFLGRKSDAEELLIRITDVVCSLVILILASPILLLIAILVKLSSPGPVFYTQQRAGKDGNIFTLYKFRTMKQNTYQVFDLAPARENDPRVTRVGRLLRKIRLDELPQLINVLKGQMSLVGPRPENMYRVENHKVLQGIRLAVKPGLTGLAQIRSFYDLKPKHKIKYDHLYVQRRSLLLNLYILAKTVPVIFSKTGW